MVTVPGDTPVISPEPPTEAIDVLLLRQVPTERLSDSSVLVPLQTVPGPVIGEVGYTVTDLVAGQPSRV